MKVLILGAGASRAAGYPLANELMSVIERDAIESGNSGLARVWNEWQSIKISAPPELRILLEHRNPEIIFSLLDLCLICFNDDNVARSKKERVEEAISDSLSRNEIPDDRYLSAAHAWIDNAGTAAHRLVDSLEEYFAYRQYSDLTAWESRQYLRDLFSSLQKGDVVITLNWDAVADRSLFETNRWSPRDGYGFEKQLIPQFSNVRNLPARLTTASEIKLLKLHGSVGWRSRDDRHFAFDGDFLQGLLSDYVDEVIVDAQAEHQGFGRPMIMRPSYLKTFKNRFLREVWWQADLALRSAEIVEIYGYSLPESDVAMSLLLGSLRSRAATGEVKVTVNDPNGEVLDRYRTFLDGNVSLRKQALGWLREASRVNSTTF